MGDKESFPRNLKSSGQTVKLGGEGEKGLQPDFFKMLSSSH